jgi:LysR family tcuABC transcriptional regulator
MLMDAVDAGLGCTIQPWAALGRFPDARSASAWPRSPTRRCAASIRCAACRTTSSRPAALAVRVVLAGCARELVQAGRWAGREAGAITIVIPA